MKYKIEGADPRTGEDRTIIVEAVNDSEAEVVARQSGLLVSTVRPAPGTAAEKLESMMDSRWGSSPATPQTIPIAYASPRSKPAIEQYTDITSGARMLRFFAFFASVVGILSLVLAVVAGFVAGKRAVDDGSSNPLVIGVSVAASFLGTAFGALVIAVSLKMYASLAIAIRDMARNSFKD